MQPAPAGSKKPALNLHVSILALGTDGDITLTDGRVTLTLDPSEVFARRLESRLRLFLGTWFLDTTLGVPYFQAVFVKNPDLGVISQILRKVIQDTPGTKQILSLSLDHRTTTRTLEFACSVQCDTGAIIDGGAGEPFRVAVPPPATGTLAA